MNLKTNSYKFLLTLSAIIAITSQKSLARIKLNQQQYSNQNGEDEQRANNAILSQDDENNYKVPFVVLMSSHEICVAQLPLIGYGNVSAVFRLVDDQLADAREFEQMPKSSSSLGTSSSLPSPWPSERQQIAAREHHPGHDREEVGKRRTNEEDIRARGVEESDRKEESPTAARTLPRKKRSSGDVNVSNSLLAGGSSSSSSSNDGPVNNNRDASSSSSIGSVQESSFATPNVTSAARSTSEQEEVVRRSRTEDDEFKNGAVQFSDFDVHMRLGFAFVADTRGRVHRFKLSGYGDGNSQPENDYTNNIRTGNRFDGSRSSSPSSSSATPQTNIGTTAQSSVVSDDGRQSDGGKHNSQRNAHNNDDDDGLSHTVSDDANKVGLFRDEFGRHPTTSGAEQSGKLGFPESGNDASSASDFVAGPSETNYNDVSSSKCRSSPLILHLLPLSFDFWPSGKLRQIGVN